LIDWLLHWFRYQEKYLIFDEGKDTECELVLRLQQTQCPQAVNTRR
jgi:hypothetical protein